MGIGAVLPPVLPASPFEGAVQIAPPELFGHMDDRNLPRDGDRVAFADELGLAGYQEGEGDGWASLVVNDETGEIVSAAVGRELADADGPDLFRDPSVTAVLMAQQRLQTFTLKEHPLILVTNRPLTRVAFGQGNWSGVPVVLCPEAGRDGEGELAALYPRRSWRQILRDSPSCTEVRHARFSDRGSSGAPPRCWSENPRVMMVSEEDAAAVARPDLDWRFAAAHFTLPAWAKRLDGDGLCARRSVDRVRHAIALSRLNAENGGGPFGSVLYDRDGDVYAIGMNQVVSQNCSLLHGEFMAYLRALAHFWTVEQFRQPGGGVTRILGGLTLATSCDPCIQCFMATLDLARFGFISRVDHGGCGADAEEIGFNEGELPRGRWRILKNGQVQVTGRRLRDQALAVLRAYAAGGGAIYNANSASDKDPTLTSP